MKKLLSITSILVAFFFGCTNAPDKPNIVLFLVDDFGVMDSSLPFLTNINGQPKKYPLNEYYRTPNIERLGNQGIRFETFYANSVCSPSRVTLMTGQSSARHKTTQWIHPEKRNAGPAEWNWEGLTSESVTLPYLLHSAGYHTIHVGKAHFGPRNTEGENPCNLGFDDNVAGCAIGRPKTYYGKNAFGEGDLRQPPHLEAYHGRDIFLTEALTLEAIKKVDVALKNKDPFFLHMAHYAVHSPFDPDPRFARNYEPYNGAKKMPAFASLVEGADKSLGDLLDHLEKKGVAENTLVILLGDNGSDAPISFSEEGEEKIGHGPATPLRGKKGHCYEGGMRVPFIAAWAKVNNENPWQKKVPIARGAITTKAFGSLEDIMPSILALTNVQAPADYEMDGQNILPSLAKADSPTNRERFLMHFPHSHRSSNFTVFRDRDWKLIRFYNEKADELYNLDQDPFELRNVATEHRDTLLRMQKEMEAELNRVDAQYWSGGSKKD